MRRHTRVQPRSHQGQRDPRFAAFSRPADAFDKASGLLLVAPITRGGTASRENGFSVNLLGTGSATQGVVLCDQTRTVDTRARTFRKLEQVPAAVIEEALDAARSILE